MASQHSSLDALDDLYRVTQNIEEDYRLHNVAIDSTTTELVTDDNMFVATIEAGELASLYLHPKIFAEEYFSADPVTRRQQESLYLTGLIRTAFRGFSEDVEANYKRMREAAHQNIAH